MALIKCTGCGHMISDRAMKCPKCGAPIVKAEEVSTTDKDKEVNAKVERPKEEPVSHVGEYNKEQNEKKKGWLWVLPVLLLCLLCGGYYAYTKFHNENDKGAIAKPTNSATSNEIKEVVEDVNEDAGKDEISSAGLTFRTFTKKESDNGNTIQFRLDNETIAANLKELGFDMIDRTTESRPDYTGEEYYEVTIETYSKTVNGHVTTVKLESDYTEIHFPNLDDVEEFKKTVRACGLAETEDGFNDTEEVYWAGTDVSIKGTVVTLSYREEA